MKKHLRKILVAIFLTLVGTASYFFNVEKSKLNEFSLNEVKELKEIIRPEDVKNFDKSSYRKVIEKEISVTKHKLIGEKLYKVAFSSQMYGKNKLKLLQMSKEHLLLAKKLGKKHEK